MNDTLDVINKLMALALNNPSVEESQSAALAAVKLIHKYQVPVGDIIADKPLEYTAPSADFYRTVQDIFEGKKATPGSDGHFSHPLDDVPGLTFVNRDLTDENPIRRQIILAWRAIREERRKLETAWYNLNKLRYGHDTGQRE